MCVRWCVCVCLCLSSLSLSHFSLSSFVVRELPCTYSRRDERCASQVLNVGALPVPLSVQVYVGELFRAFSGYVGSSWRSWPLSWLILAHLGALGLDFVAKLLQDNANMA